MKKILALVFVAMLSTLTFAGCGGTTNDETSTTTTVAVDTTAAQ